MPLFLRWISMEPFPSTVLFQPTPRRYYQSVVMCLWLLSGLTLTPVPLDQSTTGMAYSNQILTWGEGSIIFIIMLTVPFQVDIRCWCSYCHWLPSVRFLQGHWRLPVHWSPCSNMDGCYAIHRGSKRGNVQTVNISVCVYTTWVAAAYDRCNVQKLRSVVGRLFFMCTCIRCVYSYRDLHVI